MYSIVEQNALYRHLKAHMGKLLWHVVLPLVSFGPEDDALWMGDPSASARRLVDVLEQYNTPRVAASDLCQQLLRVRGLGVGVRVGAVAAAGALGLWLFFCGGAVLLMCLRVDWMILSIPYL